MGYPCLCKNAIVTVFVPALKICDLWSGHTKAALNKRNWNYNIANSKTILSRL